MQPALVYRAAREINAVNPNSRSSRDWPHGTRYRSVGIFDGTLAARPTTSDSAALSRLNQRFTDARFLSLVASVIATPLNLLPQRYIACANQYCFSSMAISHARYRFAPTKLHDDAIHPAPEGKNSCHLLSFLIELQNCVSTMNQGMQPSCYLRHCMIGKEMCRAHLSREKLPVTFATLKQ